MTARLASGIRGGVGEEVDRPDGRPKVDGSFLFSSDHWERDMLWGATLRSPHPRARLRGIDIGRALQLGGVHAILTASDLTHARHAGLLVSDQAVLAASEVTFVGEPICIVAADDPERAREAIDAIDVEFEPLTPLVDPEEAVAKSSLFDQVSISRGNANRRGEVMVEGTYEILSQDQAPLGTESGIAVPDTQGGIDLFATTQWIHDDHRQLIEILGLEPHCLRVHPAGIGGAFGAREDLTLNAHLCLLALATGRPVKMVLDRAESFIAHVHRHPAKLAYRLEADRDGTLARLEARVVIDGGAFTSTSPAVNLQLASFATGPYRIDRVEVDSYAAKTNNPPAGAMRGFGAVQACYAHEAMMDRMAAALQLDPVELRRRNLLRRGESLSTTGQEIVSSFPATEVLDALAQRPCPDPAITDRRDWPGGTGLTADPDRIRRGVGVAMGIQGIGYGAGFDDYADVRVSIDESGGHVYTAGVEVGQGLVTVLGQLARTALGVERVSIELCHTGLIGSAGSSSASRQTQVTGGGVVSAALQLRDRLLARYGGDTLDDDGVWRGGRRVASLKDIATSGENEVSVRYRPPPTHPPDPDGQGTIHAEFAVFANRAVVDVDLDLGLISVLSLEAYQDVGRVVNPLGLVGQVEGGAAQGLGLAIMEGLVIEDGRILNASFTDYLIPTTLDMPPITLEFIEDPAAWGPFGAKGAGEAPCIASGPAIAAAVRNATGAEVTSFPIRPEDLVGLAG